MGDDGDLIIGFDIHPSHSPKSSRRSKYSSALIRDGVVINEYPDISRSSLLKLVREIKPRFLATDNIFEIVPDSKSLFRFVDKIPHETHIVQVTGVPPHQISLKRLAKQHGMSIRGKPNPLESAIISAKLVSLGVGYTLECFGEQTEVKVTRGRKPGKGGQSANRFRRRVHSQIQQMTRHIESQLSEAEIEYDIDVRESDFGYSSSRIVAYAPLPVIQGLVESQRGRDFNVLVSPVRKRAEFLPLEPKPVPRQVRPKFFILGIDPGTTAAICLLSLNGKIHFLKSAKSLTRADIIREVYEHGIPILIAADVDKEPHFVKKVASTLNVNLFTPNRPIPVAEKNEIAREFSEMKKIRNAHERDALTAAIYAYRSILPKLEQIDRKIREEQLSIDRNHLKALVIKGTPINEAIISLNREETEVPEVPPAPPEPEEEPLTQERFDNLKRKYLELIDSNESLLRQIDDMKRIIEYLKFRESELEHSLKIVSRENYWKVKRDREIAKRVSEVRKLQSESNRFEDQVNQLKKRLELLRGVKRLEIRGDMIAVKTIEKFTQESITEYLEKVGLKSGDIVLFEDASGGGPQTARLLIDREIKAVIIDTPLSHLAQDELILSLIPVIDAKEVELQRIDEFAFISRKKFEEKLSMFLRDVREKARQKGEEDLISMIEQYRHGAIDDKPS
jgi:predicted RNase H-like nuclease (RuvC/YqgF family)